MHRNQRLFDNVGIPTTSAVFKTENIHSYGQRLEHSRGTIVIYFSSGGCCPKSDNHAILSSHTNRISSKPYSQQRQRKCVLLVGELWTEWQSDFQHSFTNNRSKWPGFANTKMWRWRLSRSTYSQCFSSQKHCQRWKSRSQSTIPFRVM